MFYPVKSKDGKTAFINLDLIFAFVENGNSTVAIAASGATFEIPEKLTTVMNDMENFLEDADDE